MLWNGVPIDKVIEMNAANFWGANKDAYLAQGLKYLCRRPTDKARPPAEKFVLVTYLPASGGDELEARFPGRTTSTGRPSTRKILGALSHRSTKPWTRL